MFTVDVKNYYMQFFVPEKRTSAKNFQLLEEMYVLGNCLIRLKCVQGVWCIYLHTVHYELGLTKKEKSG